MAPGEVSAWHGVRGGRGAGRGEQSGPPGPYSLLCLPVLTLFAPPLTPARPLTSTPMNWSPRSTPSGHRPKRRCTQSSTARLCPAADCHGLRRLSPLHFPGAPRHLHWPGSNPWDQIHCPRQHLRPRADALSGRPRGSKLHLTPAPAPAPRSRPCPNQAFRATSKDPPRSRPGPRPAPALPRSPPQRGPGFRTLSSHRRQAGRN